MRSMFAKLSIDKIRSVLRASLTETRRLVGAEEEGPGKRLFGPER